MKKVSIVCKHDRLESVWHIIQIIDIKQKKNRPQYRALGNTTSDPSTFGIGFIQSNILLSIGQIAFEPIVGNSSDTIMMCLPSNIEWSTVSKAFARSMKTPTVINLSSTAPLNLSTSSNRAIVVESFDRKPNWFWCEIKLLVRFLSYSYDCFIKR